MAALRVQLAQVLGTFLLWFGWYGFNPGSAGGISDELVGRTAALAAVNTTLGASGGGFVLSFFELRVTK